jgi:hypothetical protein
MGVDDNKVICYSHEVGLTILLHSNTPTQNRHNICTITHGNYVSSIYNIYFVCIWSSNNHLRCILLMFPRRSTGITSAPPIIWRSLAAVGAVMGRKIGQGFCFHFFCAYQRKQSIISNNNVSRLKRRRCRSHFTHSMSHAKPGSGFATSIS